MADEEILEAQSVGESAGPLSSLKMLKMMLMLGIVIMFASSTLSQFFVVRSDRPNYQDDEYNPTAVGDESGDLDDEEALFEDQMSWDKRQEVSSQVDKYMEVAWNVGFLFVLLGIFFAAFNEGLSPQVRMGMVIAGALMLGGLGGQFVGI